MDEFNVYFELKNYYSRYKKLIFLDKQTLDGNNNCILYAYDYTKEVENFKKSFNLYLPFYVDNYDMIKYYEINDDYLYKRSKRMWKTDMIEKNINTMGIFGELFLDFYIRIVENNEIMTTYASKSKFNDRIEFHGIDAVGISYYPDFKIQVILGEAKFVNSLTSANQDLISDIKNHLNANYLNSYGFFALNKGNILEKIHGEIVKDCVDNLNKKLVIDSNNFIDSMNDLDYVFKFVYFAIYKDNRKTPDKIKNVYNNIVNNFKNEITKTEIKNYELEIILIPTDNKVDSLKKEMVELYGEN